MSSTALIPQLLVEAGPQQGFLLLLPRTLVRKSLYLKQPKNSSEENGSESASAYELWE